MVKSPLKDGFGPTLNASEKVLNGCSDRRSPRALLTRPSNLLTHQKRTRSLSSSTFGQMMFTARGGLLSTNGVVTDGHSTMEFSILWTNSSRVSLTVFATILHYGTTLLLRYAQITVTNQELGHQDRSAGPKLGCMKGESDHLSLCGPPDSSPMTKKGQPISPRSFRQSISTDHSTHSPGPSPPENLMAKILPKPSSENHLTPVRLQFFGVALLTVLVSVMD